MYDFKYKNRKENVIKKLVFINDGSTDELMENIKRDSVEIYGEIGRELWH